MIEINYYKKNKKKGFYQVLPELLLIGEFEKLMRLLLWTLRKDKSSGLEKTR
ncbi:MAG: hypothetical protein V9F02_13610 [Chitinophagaceae bacterium]